MKYILMMKHFCDMKGNAMRGNALFWNSVDQGLTLLSLCVILNQSCM